ncbi:cadherin repeat domain-containing protein [Ulvibacter litoralis]|uniref:Cadherin domain-containing protein n=1 Tax=Ulvibacter litoralis TaxID=227084 RepID=A0A1G7EJX1_9FLAO|nr:cadherin repeat domain-containing protein [Ulvibacter litoralis]GHC54777.1 hypothetical protein GCM10008083_18880 [Ulvibacter litoralis]SDE63918.1 hypothetical protein SAMN05421855_10212 [Ulvibacter litoralis]
MKSFLSYYFFQFTLLCIAFTVVSCSKNDENTHENLGDVITVLTSNFITTVVENPEEGQLLGTVSANTNQGSITFSITEQSPAGAIAINSTSGELTVADPTLFDFETNTSVTGTVAVTNGTVSENASITITIKDFNEDNIFEGGITLETQLDIDNFGANNYTHVTGNLFIGSLNQSTMFNNLRPLSSIKHIGNQLNIYDNDGLTSLTGLENIETAGTINIMLNDVLTDISALSNITELTLSLQLYGNPVLANLNGLNNITSVSYLSITDNDSLVNLDDLHISNITESFEIDENDLLTDINGLSGISSINGELSIFNNNSLSNIDGLSNLSTLTDNLFIEMNNNLTDLCGLQNLLTNGGLSGDYTVVNNAYNPTEQDIIDGNCSI